MPCNYLVKFEDQEKYQHVIIEGCQSSQAEQIAVSHFCKVHKVTPKNYDPETFAHSNKLWVISVQGCAIFEDLFEIVLGPVRMISDPNGPKTLENTVAGVGFIAKKIESKPPRLLPGLEGLV